MSVTLRLLPLALLVPAGVAAQSPSIVLSPTTLSFTVTPASGNSPAQSVAISNGGGGTLDKLTRTITYTSPRAGTDGLDVNWLSTAFPPRVTTAPTTLDIRIHAGATLRPGVYTARVSIRSKLAANSPQSVDVFLAVGNGPVALSISPATLAFGSLGVGLTSPGQSFTITNTGWGPSGPLTPVPFATGFVGGANPQDFPGLATTCPLTGIPAGDSCTFDFAFSPRALGVRSATFGFSTSPGGEVGAALTGAGIPTQSITVTPATVDFGQVGVGVPSAAQTVTVTNTGSVATGPFTLVPSGNVNDFGGNPGSTCQQILPVGLPAGGSCTIVFTFTPTAAGTRSMTVTLSATPGGLATINLVGTGGASLTLTPAAHDFGSVGLGFTSQVAVFTLTNVGTAPSGALAVARLLGSHPGDFVGDASTTCAAIGPTGLAAGASCTVGVTFQPQAQGARSATLEIGALGGLASAALTGTGSGLIVTPASHDFGGVLQGQHSPAATFTVTNATSAALFLNSILASGPNPADFSVDPSNLSCFPFLASLASCTFEVVFSPQGTGVRSATVTISGPGTPTGSAALTGHGDAEVIILTVRPTSHDFGSVIVGQTSPARSFTVTNLSGPALSLNSINLSGPNAADFTVDPSNLSCFPSLAPGASCTFDVAFRPQNTGARSATVTISGPGGTPSASAQLSGTGDLAIVLLTVTPASHDFGTVGVGLSSTAATFTVTNPTSTAALLDHIDLSGPNAADFAVSFLGCLTLLAPGASCTFDVLFSPQATGAKSATVTVSGPFNHRGSAQVTGSGAPALVLNVSPASFDFGNRQVGYTSGGTPEFTVTNPTGTTTAPLQIAFTGAAAADYSDDSFPAQHCAGASLAPGASCRVTVKFVPQATGVRSATLTVSSSVDGSFGSAALTGTGVPPAVLTVTPASKDFGTVVVGQSSSVVSFVLNNSGPVTAGLINTDSLTGVGSTDYNFHPFQCGSITVDVGTSCTFHVSFRPLAAGPRPATLVIVFSGGTASVSLTGIGTLPPIIAGITAASAVRDLLGEPTLTPEQRAYLDQLGNRNGSYDLGDLLAFLDRHRLKLSPALLDAARRKERIP